MIFEQAYAEWLSIAFDTKLQAINPDLASKMYDEVSRKALKSGTNEVALVVQGGNASRLDVEGIDRNTMPLSVTVICADVNKTAVRNALDNLQKEYHASPMALQVYDGASGTAHVVKMKSLFSTPFVLDERNWNIDSGSIIATVIQMSASVIYGANAFVEPIVWKLRIEDTTYIINSVVEYNLSSSPSYDEYVGQGNAWMARNALVKCAAYAFTIARVSGDDPLQAVLENELLTGNLADKEMELYALVDNVSTTIPITSYTVNETFTDNASAYMLTLSR